MKPGRSTRVLIHVKPASAVSAYAVEEKAPQGCLVSQVDNKGFSDSKSNTIKWGVFFDRKARTLSYQLACPDELSGPLMFSGMASFNGDSVEIGGMKSLK